MRRGLLAFSFLFVTTVGHAQSKPGECPQARRTPAAPAVDLAKKNPLPANAEHLKAGRALFNGDADTDACTLCHGGKGDGKGKLARLYDPPPRNFTCAATMAALPDGQLFWAIRSGIADSGMPPHRDLTDTQVWQLVLVVRQFAQ